MASSSVMEDVPNHIRSGASKKSGATGSFALCLRDGHPGTSLRAIRGIGPKLEEGLEAREIYDARDLLLVLPRRYRRLQRFPDASLLAAQPEHVVLFGEVTSVSAPNRWSRRPLEVQITAHGGRFVLTWFNLGSPRFVGQFRQGRMLVVEGAVDWSRGLPRMTHPNIEWVSEAPREASHATFDPVYPATDPMGPRLLRRAILETLERLSPFLTDVVPADALEEHGLPTVAEALRSLHAVDPPEDPAVFEATLQKARDRLVYEEFHLLQVSLAKSNHFLRANGRAPQLQARDLGRRFVKSLPYELTSDQRQVIATLAEELGRRVPMRRLLQGDVGSGKTVVAFMAAAIAVGSGSQVALMAPTEVLAAQHFARANESFHALGLRIGLLTGSTSVSERRKLLAGLGAGKVDLLVGTHALFSEDVEFEGLGLVVIDEQHKFGVDQRAALLSKGRDPHLLAMTATPIPRSLAHALFGDLDLAVLREKPPGREPVRTYLRPRTARPKVYEWVRGEIRSRGRRAYVVFPLIESGNDNRDLAPLLEGAEELANGVFRGLRVGVLHGRMSPADKLAIMQRFERGDVDVLCATTVIEVGIDVPDATMMVIESPEAFGLSQLHQLRGRVGRGDETSRCVLLHGVASPEAQSRLEAFTRTSDGFELAEIDLVTRGPGEFLGSRQSGAAEFRFADIVRDARWLELARADARRSAGCVT